VKNQAFGAAISNFGNNRNFGKFVLFQKISCQKFKKGLNLDLPGKWISINVNPVSSYSEKLVQSKKSSKSEEKTSDTQNPIFAFLKKWFPKKNFGGLIPTKKV